MIYSFTNDYNETAHPKIFNAFLQTANQKNAGYGLDDYCKQAAEIIKKQIKSPESDVHFLPGGTITNLVLISHALRPYQAVICAQTGHIAVHETGAIEATGHKVITVQSNDGKLTPEMIKPVLVEHCDEHMVQPKMVYISNTTEIGTIYTKQELQALSTFCRNNNLYLYLDGARLAMALTAKENDLTLADLAELTDAFYIGGTKVGAFNGEALVINSKLLNDDIRFSMKQKGAIQAKSWLLGMQFITLMQDDLYFELGQTSNTMANQLKIVLEKQGLSFVVPPQTNQLFVKVPNQLVEKLTQTYSLADSGAIDAEHTCLRFCTSWATTKSDIEEFEVFLKNII